MCDSVSKGCSRRRIVLLWMIVATLHVPYAAPKKKTSAGDTRATNSKMSCVGVWKLCCAALLWDETLYEGELLLLWCWYEIPMYVTSLLNVLMQVFLTPVSVVGWFNQVCYHAPCPLCPSNVLFTIHIDTTCMEIMNRTSNTPLVFFYLSVCIAWLA